MTANFPFHRALALMLIFVILVVPFSGAVSASGGPVLPTPPTNGPLGYLMFGEQQVSTPLTPADPDRYRPESAYDPEHGRFLVVWHQTYASGHDREIYGQLINANGTKYGSPIVISSGSHDRTNPAVAYGWTHHEYMVVFMYDVNGDGKKYDIQGQRISANGVKVGLPFTVITYENRSFWSPRIAWNSLWDEFMVVWGALAQDTQDATDVAMNVFDYTGAALYGGWIVTTEGFPTNPDIAFDPIMDKFLVVWNYLNASGKNVIRGSLRYDNGNPIQAVDIYGSTTNESMYPRVTSSMGIFFGVVWDYMNSSTDHDIYISLINSTGGVLYSVPLVDGATNDTHPDIAGSNRQFEYMIDFQRADVNGAKVLMRPFSNYLSSNLVDICNYVFTDCMLPSIEFGGATFMHTYVIDVSTFAPETSPLTPISVQHVFDRALNTSAIYLPLIRK